MKRILSLFLVGIMIVSLLASCSDNTENKGDDTTATSNTPTSIDCIYVDVNAAESGDGSETAPDKTVAEAQAKVREMKSENTIPEGGISIVLAEGDYPSIKLTAEDSGTEDRPITYISAKDKGARITGGITLNYTDFESISDDEAARLFDKNAAEHILKVDLKKYGLTADDWGAPRADGGKEIEAELYIDAKRMTIAKYPNEGFFFVGEAPIGDVEGDDGKKNAIFEPSDEVKEHIAFWSNIVEMSLAGYYTHDWTYSTGNLSVDESSNSIIVEGFSSESVFNYSRYHFKNAYEEIDMSGEYYIDRQNGILYLYATEGLENSKISLAVSKESLAVLDNVSYVNIKDIVFCETRTLGISVAGHHITFDNITLYGTGDRGFFVMSNTAQINTDMTDVVLKNSEISHTGSTAVFFHGGNATTLKKSNNLIYNNYIHDFAEIARTYEGAIKLVGTGITVSHNEICNSSHTAIFQDGGPYCVIEYNEIYNVCNETSDCGAIYSGRRGIRYGTEIKYNYIHDIGTKDVYDYKADYFRAAAIYMDDGIPGISIVGNLIENTTGRGIYMGGGRDCVVSNNIMINCDRFAIEFDSRMHDAVFTDHGWFPLANIDNMQNELKTFLEASDVWEEAFPTLATINFNYAEADKNDPTLFVNPVNNVVTNNIHTDGGDKRVYIESIEHGKFKEYNKTDNNWKFKLTDFVDYENGNYTLRTDSALYKRLPGWEDVPYAEMGRIVEE